MRVLYFTRGWTVHDRRFLDALGKTGHEVFYLRLEGGQRTPPDLPTGVRMIYWNGLPEGCDLRDGQGLIPELKRLVEKLHPDVIQAGPIQRVARLAACAGLHPLVSTSWGSDLLVEAGKDDEWQQATLEALKSTDILVGDCQTVHQKAVSLGFPAERIVYFPWGIDLAHFQPGAEPIVRREAGWQNTFTLLSLRAWEPLYGVDVIVKAFVLAVRVCPELRLYLLGSGSEEKQLYDILERSSMMDRVWLGGHTALEDLPGVYTSTDLYLSASHSDGTSISLLEAMACARPVLCSDIPGNREWITPGENGWLFPDSDVDSLAQAIVDAVRQPELLKPMGEAGRRVAEERADWQKNFPKLLQAYDMAVRFCAQA